MQNKISRDVCITHIRVSGDLTGGSPSTSVTVYTKHVHVMFNQQTVSSLQTLGTYKENELPKNCRFSKNSVLNPQTAHEPFLRLGFLSQLSRI